MNLNMDNEIWYRKNEAVTASRDKKNKKSKTNKWEKNRENVGVWD